MEKIFQIILEKDDFSWQSLLYQLVESEGIDPWDIDISLLTEKYLETIKKMQDLDLRVSGKVLLAAAILLKIKSTYLLDHDFEGLDRLIASTQTVQEEEFFSEFDENLLSEEKKLEKISYPLISKHPQPRKRKVSIYDLIKALEKAIEVHQRKIFRHKPIEIVVEGKKFDLTEVIKKLHQKIILHFKKNQQLSFSQLVPSEKKEDKIFTFIPLLHLDFEKKINLEQEKHFSEIWVKLKKSQA